MASASSFLGGDFLKGEVVKASGPVKGIINGWNEEKFEARGNEPARTALAIVLDLGETEKKMTLNKTNLRLLISSYGDDPDLWTGRPVIVYFDPNVSFGGRTVGGLKIKLPAQKAAGTATPASESPAVLDDDLPF